MTNFVAGFALLASNGALKRFVPGLAFSAFGDVVEVGAGGATVSGVPLATGGDAGAVSALTVEASAHQQPIIELRVAPTDAAARVVPGLAASNFAVEEDGVRVSAVVRENGAAARVLLLWDCTGSQPALTDPMAAGLADAVFAAAPGASAQVTALDGAAAASGFTLTTPAAVKQALLAVSGATSPVYAGLMSALAAAPTLVVLFTDGNAEPLPALASQCLAALGSCPVLAVGCHGASAATRPEVLQPIAAASGGAFVDGGDLSDLTATRAGLAAVAGRRSALPYRLAYASRGGAGVHHVQVRVGPASAGADFTLTGTPAVSSEFVGVHLRLEMDGTLAERTLVGLAPAAIPAAADVAAQLAQASQAVRDFFLSSAWITFEGGAPTLSAWLDDALSATIAREPLNEAVRAKDAAGAYAAAESAPTAPPLRSLLAHAPLPQPDGTPVVEAALRAAVHLTLPLARATSVDLLPTTRFVTLGAADDQATFAATMRASLRLAVAESAMSLGSTRSALAGVALAAIPPGFVNPADLAAFPQAVRESFTAQLERHHDAWRLVAADGSRRAFWAVDRATGTALGVLPDGTGGAIESCQEIVEYAQLAIDALGILLAQIDTGLAPTFTFIAAVGKAASVAVAEAALSFTDPLIDPSILQLGATIACSVGSDLVGDHLPLPGGMTGVENSFLQNLGGGTIMDQNPICQAATPCTRTAPP